MRLFGSVAVIGTGLIGGSLALAIRKKHLAREVIGISRSSETLALARRYGAVDKASRRLEDAAGVDLVILATPISTMLKIAPLLARSIAADCIVSDVGSTKKTVTERLSAIFPRFVGAHPLAGLEKRGIMHAAPDLFKGSACILTPTACTDRIALRKIKSLWKAVGARPALLTPDEHDRVLSFVSHLPHALAYAAIGSVPPGFLKFAASGLKDTTRIASSDPALWADIFLTNRKHLLAAIASFEARLLRIRSAIGSGDRRVLERLLEEAKQRRDTL